MIFYILNKDEELLTVVSNDSPETGILYSAVLKEKLNDLHTLELELSSAPSVAQYLAEENYVLFKDLLGDWQLYKIKEVTDSHSYEKFKTVYCENASQELYDDLCEYEIDGVSLDINVILTEILQTTRWLVGTVENGSAITYTGMSENKSVLEALHMLRTQHNSDIKFRYAFTGNVITGRYVDILDSAGSDIGKRFEYRKDIEKIERVVNTADLKTAVKILGKDGLNIADIAWTTPTNPLNKPLGQLYLEDTVATANWGHGLAGDKRPRFLFVEDTESITADELISKAYNLLTANSVPKTTYTLEVIDLFALTGDSTLSFESVKLGDIVTVIDREFVPEVAVKSSIIEREVDLLLPENTKVVLGSYQSTQMDFNNSVDSTVEVAIGNIREFGNGSYSDIESINDQSFHEAVGFTYLKDTEGLWVYNEPITGNPSKVVAIKGGQVAIGAWNTGTQKWDIGTFIDGDSVNATMINTGTMNADLIKTGLLQSIDGSTWINMETGEFSFADGSLTFSAGSFHIGLNNNLGTELAKKADQTTIEDLQNYLDWKPDTGLRLSKIGSNYSINIDDDSMDFYNLDTVVASISGQLMTIANIKVLSALTVGVHEISRYGTTNVTLIKFVG